MPVVQGTITAPQVIHQPDPSTHELDPAIPIFDWYKTIRDMRKDPTVALVRTLMIAPAVLGPWTFETKEDAPEGAMDLVKESFEPIKNRLIRNALLMALDFGWAPYEVMFEIRDDNMTYLRGMKQLLHDFTWILANPDTGAFEGFRQKPITGKELKDVDIPLKRAFLHSIDVEGTYWYGQSMMENVRGPYKWWNTTNKSNERYDEKLAGAQWVIEYPMGTSTYNGAKTDNGIIAKDLLNKLQSSGGIAVPRKVREQLETLENDNTDEMAWKIDLKFATGSQQSGYTDRLKYLDALKVRALGWPERSVLEGQFGTKAEAETHSDFAIATMELRHDDFLTDLNNDPVNQLLSTNYGPEAKDSVWISRGPISDLGRKFLEDVYMKFLDKPVEQWTPEYDHIDVNALREILSVPSEEMEDDALLIPFGPGEGVRQDERGSVGDGGQPGESEGGLGSGDMGDIGGGSGDR